MTGKLAEFQLKINGTPRHTDARFKEYMDTLLKLFLCGTAFQETYFIGGELIIYCQLMY